MRSDDDDARALMDDTVAAIVEAVVTDIDRGWQLSQQATLLALARVLAFLAQEYVRHHPQAHDDVRVMLRSVVDCVEVATATKH